MQKILIIEPVLAHYRKDVFNCFLNNKEYKFELLAGRNYNGIKEVDNIGTLFSYAYFSFFKHKYYYLKGSLKYIFSGNYDIIICSGVDFHLLHTLLLFFLWRVLLNRKLYWWSHATIGNQGRMGFLLRKFIYRSSTGVFVYNQKGRDNLLSMRVLDERIIVVNNSINREDYGYLNYDLNKEKNHEVFSILYSGRLTKEKKVDVLIRALGILKKRKCFEFKCFIIGNGEIGKLHRLAEEENVLEIIEFTGAKYAKEVQNFFLNSDVFIYPGGIGLSALHALSFGLPVITTDNLRLHFPEFELIVPGYTGDLFTDNSAESLADKIIEWKERIYRSRDSYMNNCIQQIIDMEYLPDIMTGKVLSHLKNHEFE
jgi:glycosyltransferase involved in cell wall biosynthesis